MSVDSSEIRRPVVAADAAPSRVLTFSAAGERPGLSLSFFIWGLVVSMAGGSIAGALSALLAARDAPGKALRRI